MQAIKYKKYNNTIHTKYNKWHKYRNGIPEKTISNTIINTIQIQKYKIKIHAYNNARHTKIQEKYTMPEINTQKMKIQKYKKIQEKTYKIQKTQEM